MSSNLDLCSYFLTFKVPITTAEEEKLLGKVRLGISCKSSAGRSSLSLFTKQRQNLKMMPSATLWQHYQSWQKFSLQILNSAQFICKLHCFRNQILKYWNLAYNDEIDCSRDWISGFNLSHVMRFPTMWYVQPAKAQTSLRIGADWSEPLLVAWVFYGS